MREQETRRRERRQVEKAIDDAFAAHASEAEAAPAGETHDGDSGRLAAHEIRSHLAVLTGYISMIEDGSLGELPTSIAHVIPEIHAKARAIARLVEDMLEDARLEDGRLHIARRLVDLRELVESSVGETRRSLPRTHRLVQQVPSEPVIVDVDPGRIATILRNLLDNAVKYSPAGGLIECRLDTEGDHATVRVTDEGIGIDQADQDGLFRRFGRGQALSRAAIEGTGLGLYICRTIAELHGGGMSFSPRAAGGSVFTLRLPLPD